MLPLYSVEAQPTRGCLRRHPFIIFLTVLLCIFTIVNLVTDPGDEAEIVVNVPTKEVEVREEENEKEVVPARKADPENDMRREAIVDAMKFVWKNYEERAFGMDELKPISGKGITWLGTAASLLDSLDTLYLMGMTEEFERAKEYVRDELVLNVDREEVSFFETVIRSLGGLLSAYDLSKDKVFLNRATELGDLLMAAFDSSSGIPYTWINLKKGKGANPSWQPRTAILSEIATVQLEFTYLSAVTGNLTYAKKALKVMKILEKANRKLNGLYPVFLDQDTGKCDKDDLVSYGSKGDSYFEYLMKMWLFVGGSTTNKIGKFYRDLYDKAMDRTLDELVDKTDLHGKTFIWETKDGKLDNKFDHLNCFAGAMFALGAKMHADKHPNHRADEHFAVAEGITDICHDMYALSPTGLASEIIRITKNSTKTDFIVDPGARHNLLRPETVESYLFMWRLTHDQKYRDWGWDMWQAFERNCKSKYGYAGLENVQQVPPQQSDTQPSYFMAETLKYMYLLFSDDDVIPIDKYVFNTEAHPLSIKPKFDLDISAL